MAKIQEVINAQVHLRDGMSDQIEIQLQVYEEGCNGYWSVVIIPHSEFIEYLNGRKENA